MAVIRALTVAFSAVVACVSVYAEAPSSVEKALAGDVASKAAPAISADTGVPGYLARIALDDPYAIQSALKRAEEVYLSNEIPAGFPPVVFVLHGPEVAVFQKQNYSRYKSIVDLAARLTAFQVVDIRICRTQLSNMNSSESSLFPFVGSVPLGPAEQDRLMTVEQYVYF